MDVHVIPKLVGRIITQHSVPCHVVVMGQVARYISPSFDDLLYANQHHHNSLEWRDKAATIKCTGKFTIRGHAVLSVELFVIDLTNDDAVVMLHPFQEPAPIDFVELPMFSEDMAYITDDNTEESHSVQGYLH